MPSRPPRGAPPGRRRKALGQNFLTNQDAADRIVELFAPVPGQPVLEIGPGEGVLTVRLLARGAVVVAVERDSRLAGALERRWGPRDGFHLHIGDARRVSLDGILAGHLVAGGRARVLSNLPYSVGTELVVRLLHHGHLLEEITVMLQREVADRICRGPGSRVYGSLSVLAQYFTSPRRLMTLEPGSFRPRPAVRSAVVAMPFRKTRELAPERERLFAAFVLTAFRSRRRTLPNNLAPAWRCDPGRAVALIRKAGIDPGLRPEMLDRDAFIRLFKAGSGGV